MAKKKGLSAVWLDAMNKAGGSLINDPRFGAVYTDVEPVLDALRDLTKGVKINLDAPILDEPEGINIWVDGIRDPADYGYPNAVWCKDSSQFLTKLMCIVLDGKMDSLLEVHFDNDLGERTEGYDLFVFLEESLHKGSFKNLKKIYVHSSNPSAVQKFMLAKDSLKKYFGIEMIRNQY